MCQQSYIQTYPDVDKASIWQLWSDIENWPKWDQKLAYCKIDNNGFAAGTSFILKPINGPTVKIHLSNVIPHQQFTQGCPIKN